MSDIIDQTDEREAVTNQARLALIRQRAIIDPGASGECDFCGEWTGRLIQGVCCACRDKRKLP